MLTKTQLIEIMDTAERRAFLEIIGDVAIPSRLRDLIADIFDPITQALRRARRRDGRLPLRDV